MYLGYFHTIPDSFCNSLRKQPTFQDAKGGFPARWCLRSERRNSKLMTSRRNICNGRSEAAPRQSPKWIVTYWIGVYTFLRHETIRCMLVVWTYIASENPVWKRSIFRNSAVKDSLRTAEVFPVVASLPPKNRERSDERKYVWCSQARLSSTSRSFSFQC